MDPVFEIIPEAIFFQQTNLVCEVSPDGFSYIFFNAADKKFHGLSVFHFAAGIDISEQVATIFKEQPLLHKTYKKVFVCYTGKESALIPEELYKKDDDELILATLYGDLEKSLVAADHIADKKMYNIHRVPVGVRQLFVDKFPAAFFCHHNSLLVKQGFPAADKLNVIFYKNTFIVALVKLGELQIMNTYSYLSGTDVVFHLLNICRHFKMENVPLQIGGMIEIDSDLHKEIQHYFTQINFAALPPEYEYSNALKKLQAHHFSHLFYLASCV